MPPFWQNRRGELYVIGQFLLFAGIVFIPPDSFFSTPLPHPVWLPVVGLSLTAGAFFWTVAATSHLCRNLTPFVCPKAHCTLVESGLYRIVRHPIYTGLLFGALGWSLYRLSLPALLLTLCLFILFDAKARREEIWLLERFPGYADYRRRVKKLIPFLY